MTFPTLLYNLYADDVTFMAFVKSNEETSAVADSINQELRRIETSDIGGMLSLEQQNARLYCCHIQSQSCPLLSTHSKSNSLCDLFKSKMLALPGLVQLPLHCYGWM